MPNGNRETPLQNSRIDRILAQRRRGSTLQEIANEIGVTRERVRQILSEHPEAPTAEEARQARKAEDQSRREQLWVQELSAAGIENEQVVEHFHNTFSVELTAEQLQVDRDAVEWALDQAGVDHTQLEVSRPSHSQRTYSDAQLLEYLRLAHEHIENEYLSRAAFDDFASTQHLTPERWPSGQLITVRYEKWSYACEAAGIPAREGPNRRRTFDVATCLRAVADFLTECDSAKERPTFAAYTDWAKKRDWAPSGGTVRNRVDRRWAKTVVQARHFLANYRKS